MVVFQFLNFNLNFMNEVLKKIRIVIIGGIRTHFIKINSIQKMFDSFPNKFKKLFDLIYINVGQHYDYALTSYIDECNLHFDYTINHENKNNFEIYSKIFHDLGVLLDKINDEKLIDYAIVMGDVATTAIASLVTIIKKIKLIHIEAGVRILRGDGLEEYYRCCSDHMSHLCFATTMNDYENLLNEKIGGSAFFSGDIIYDYIKNFYFNSQVRNFKYLKNGILYDFPYCNEKYILSSLHHVENLSVDNLQNLFEALNNTNYKSIFIAHPRVKKIIFDNDIKVYNTIIADGIPYNDNLTAIKNSLFCITDSGGIQREAFYFNKRCLVRSDLTVWKSIIKIGSNLQIGSNVYDYEIGIKWCITHLNDSFDSHNIFGDGDAVYKIFQIIERDAKNVIKRF